MIQIDKTKGKWLVDLIVEKEEEIKKLTQEVQENYDKLANIRIAPFKAGDKIKCVLNGKSVVGILEVESSPFLHLYIRPFTKKGTTSEIRRAIWDYDTVEKVEEDV